MPYTTKNVVQDNEILFSVQKNFETYYSCQSLAILHISHDGIIKTLCDRAELDFYIMLYTNNKMLKTR